MNGKLVTIGIGLAVSVTALAQTSFNRSQEQEAIAAVVAVGGTCERVVRNQQIGLIDDNTTLMAISCSGGEEPLQFVIQLDTQANMSFYSTCENLALGTNNQVRCFSNVEDGRPRRGNDPGRRERDRDR